jgi:7-cyano-7-deazaguanine synthase
MTTRPRAVVLFSGGLDSTVLATSYAQTHELLLLTIDYGQRHHRELDAAAAVAGHLRAEHLVLPLPALGHVLTSALTDRSLEVPDGHYTHETMTATVVPNRNAILANVAVGVAAARGAELVALGVHAGDHAIYADCTPPFIDALRTCVRTALDNPPTLVAPFLHAAKSSIVRFGDAIDAPLHLSWSCYKGGQLHCGRCGTCTERAEAFQIAEVPDPTSYADPWFWVEACAAR